MSRRRVHVNLLYLLNIDNINILVKYVCKKLPVKGKGGDYLPRHTQAAQGGEVGLS